MTRTEAIEEIKSRYADYLQEAKKRVGGKPTYICPLPECGNGSGADGDGIAINPKAKSPYALKCFKCGFSGSIIDLFMQENNCDFETAFTELCDRFGISIDGTESKATHARPNREPEPSEPEAEPDNTEYYKSCKAHINDPAAQAYLTFRGLSNETARRFWIGYDPQSKYLIIPATQSYYIARNTDSQSKKRYDNPAHVSVELFNKKALYNDAGRPVFITEGAIDALSIIEAGGEAVGLNGTSNTRKLLEELKKQKPSGIIIICLDNDPDKINEKGQNTGRAGQKAAATLAEGLRELNISYIQADICGEHKDPNDALTADKNAFIEAVEAAERSTSKPDNTIDYIRQSMTAEIDAIKAQITRKSGYANLDAEAGSIYAGLYVVGGISSVGKTTFISQLADQMAEQGQHVLFFSMEQSRLEMVSKSIARQTVKTDPAQAVTSLQVRTGTRNNSINKALADYVAAVGDRISVIEGNFNCTVSFIKDYTARYIEKNGGIKPVVIVDYLQVLQPDKDPQTGRKMTDTRQIVDHNVTELKRISRLYELPVFIISSVNRSNYLTPIDFEAFKESGGIEYTADVVWGLQLAAIHDPIFDSDKKVKEKREKIAKAKEEMPRNIELVCLKNRYGKSRYAALFTYYPQYDYFKPEIKDFEGDIF